MPTSPFKSKPQVDEPMSQQPQGQRKSALNLPASKVARVEPYPSGAVGLQNLESKFEAGASNGLASSVESASQSNVLPCAGQNYADTPITGTQSSVPLHAGSPELSGAKLGAEGEGGNDDEEPSMKSLMLQMTKMNANLEDKFIKLDGRFDPSFLQVP